MPANISANFMERIAIIDHLEHTLFIEDIDEDELQEKYGGEEEEYIKKNYELSDNWSWEYITKTFYTIMDYFETHEVKDFIL